MLKISKTNKLPTDPVKGCREFFFFSIKHKLLAKTDGGIAKHCIFSHTFNETLWNILFTLNRNWHESEKMIAVCAALAVTVVTASARDKKQPTGMEDRQVWVNTLVKIADPVLSNLANNTLRENMPQESLDTKRVHRFSHLEAVGRTLCGIAPWLELGADETEEGKLRGIKAFENNWLLFASIVEVALLEFTGECDLDRLTYGVFRFRDDWYKGDGVYGDGPSYHADYYNSFVIHPMLTDVLKVMKKHGLAGSDFLSKQLKRQARYAEQLERMISPEGAYPAVGRSITYRVGAFHALAHAALLHELPKTVAPAQVRCGLTAVIARQFAAPRTFDEKGWLRIGFAGSQINMSETYINTGSVYLCTFGFLALGLPATDPFWTEPFTPWTGLKAWNGEDVMADHAIGD